MRARRDLVLLAILIVAAIYVFWDSSRNFNQADEFWYGQIVRGMLDTGDLITPRLGPRPDHTKPPVFFYLSLPAAAVLPSFQQAMRLLPGLCFLGVLLLVYRLARPAFGLGGARLAAVVFLLGYDQLHLHGFRSGVIEGLLSLELAWLLWLNMRLRKHPSSIRWILFGLALTFMSKTAFVAFPAAVTLFNLWLQRGRLRIARVHVLQGLALAMLVILPWLTATCAVNGPVVLEVLFFREIVQRAQRDPAIVALGQSFGRSEPLYAIQHVLSFGQPWCLFLPPAVWVVWRERGAPLTSRRLLLRLSALWAVAVLCVFTASQGVWGWYTHSLYVPGALLVGSLLERWLSKPREVPEAVLVGLSAGALFLSPIPFAYGPYADSAAGLPLDALIWQRAGLAVGLACVFSLIAKRSRQPCFRWPIGAAVALALALSLYTSWLLHETSLETPALILLLPTALAGAAMLTGERARRLSLGCVSALLLLGAAYLIGPLRFARNPTNERSELIWLRHTEGEGGLSEAVELQGPFYSWIVLYHARSADYAITYDMKSRMIRIAPR